MIIHFATCDRKRALNYLQEVYPSHSITDEPHSAKPLLDLVEKDIVRIEDPTTYGKTIKVIPGENWKEEFRLQAVSACEVFHNPIKEKILARVDEEPAESVCPRCEGTGRYRRFGFPEKDCSLCNGTGLMSEAVKGPTTAEIEELFNKHASYGWSGDAAAVGPDEFAAAIREFKGTA